jgi:hypothetical protein
VYHARGPRTSGPASPGTVGGPGSRNHASLLSSDPSSGPASVPSSGHHRSTQTCANPQVRGDDGSSVYRRDAEGFALALGEAQDPEHTPGFPTSDSICTGLRRSRSWHDHSRPELGIGSVARRECFGQAGDRADSPGGSAEEGRATRRRQIQRSRGTFGRSSTTPYALKASPRGNGYRRPIARFPDIRRSAGSSLPHVPRSRI